jgi:hypothetical protein
LEELGIEPDKIKKKFLAILTQSGMQEISAETDMTGTIVVCVLIGLLLMFKGKIKFGNIYGFGLSGCIALYLLINLLIRRGLYLDLYTTMTVIGDSLLPFVFLAVANLFFNLMNPCGIAFGVFIVLWSSVTATRLFEYSLDMKDQRFLIAYPIALFYCVFVILTVF